MTSLTRTFEERELLELLMSGENRAGRPTPFGVQDDGSLRTWTRLIGIDSSGDEQTHLVEDDGTPRSSLYGTTSGSLNALRVYTGGELAAIFHGTDESSNVDPFRTDPDRILWIRRRRHLYRVTPAVIPAVDGILLDGSTLFNAADTVEVTFEVNNVDGTDSVTVDVWVDIQAGGTPADRREYLFKDKVIPAGGSTGPKRFIMQGDDDLRGVAGVANDAAVNFIRVERVDVNA